VYPYLPSAADQVIIGRTKFTPAGHLLPPWTGFAVFCGYTLAVLTAAAITLHHRDA
jgi:ABC-2 type transport system permease protein